MLVLSVGGASLLSACDRKDGPMEDLGKKVDQQIDTAKEHYQEGVEELKDEADDRSSN